MSSVERSIDYVRNEVTGLKNAVKEIAETLKRQNPTEETKRLEYVQIIDASDYVEASLGIDRFTQHLRKVDPDASIVDAKLTPIFNSEESIVVTIIYRSNAEIVFPPDRMRWKHM